MRVQTSRNVDVSQNSNGHISVVCDATVTLLGMLVVYCVLCNVHADVTLTQLKVKVTELLNFRKLHFSRSIFFAIFAWNSKPMVDYYDNMGPSLQFAKTQFLNFLLSKLLLDFRLCGMSILQDLRAMFPYCLTLESDGRVCW